MSIGGLYTAADANVIQHFFCHGGLSDLIAALAPDKPKSEPAPAELTPQDWAKLDTPVDKPFPPPSFTREQTQALIELADERIFAKARAAEQDQPERRRTYDEILAENRERLRAGETVLMPYIYPGLSIGETWSIAQKLRELSTLDPECGLLHDPYHATDQGAE